MRNLLRKTAVVMAISAALTGCATLEDYEFGDVTKTALSAASKIITLKKTYCSEKNSEERQLLLHAIRLADPDYDGACDGDKN